LFQRVDEPIICPFVSISRLRTQRVCFNVPMHRKTVQILASCASAVEFYDFVVYSFFATYIGKNFFPDSSSFSGLLSALAVFGAGFAARPIGALVLGRYADRHGRRPAMIFTMVAITLATLAVGVLPTYEQIGVFAPALLVLCRLVQGFAMGGEAGAATAYLLEAAPPGQKGQMCSWFLAGQGAATFLAGCIGTLLTLYLSHDQMSMWGWRIPFLMSVFLAPLAFYLRRSMPETTVRLDNNAGKHASRLLQTMRDRRVLLITVALVGGSVANYMCSYLTTFAIATLSLPASIALSATIVVGAATFIGALVGGRMSDRLGTRPVLLWSRLICTLMAMPAFMILIEFPSAACLWTIAALLSITNGINGGALFAPLAASFRQEQRAGGVALSYACGLALVGGTSQFVVTGLIKVTGIQSMPGLYMLVTGMLAFAALFFLPEQDRDAGVG
jgi:MFS family permease